MSFIYTTLSDWSGTNALMFSTLEFGLGFACALALMQLCFHLFAVFIRRTASQLSGLQLSLLFACATWSIFLSVLATPLQQYHHGFSEVYLILIASIVLAPFSILAGIPVLLVYATRRPVLQSRGVYISAGAICLTSYLYLIWLEQAFQNSS